MTINDASITCKGAYTVNKIMATEKNANFIRITADKIIFKNRTYATGR